MTDFVCFFAKLIFDLALEETVAKIDQTEVFIAEFAQFFAATGYITKAEHTGGMLYESG